MCYVDVVSSYPVVNKRFIMSVHITLFTHVMHCITWVNNMQLVFVLVLCVGHTA